MVAKDTQGTMGPVRELCRLARSVCRPPRRVEVRSFKSKTGRISRILTAIHTDGL